MQRSRHCSCCLRRAYVDSPYAISLRKALRDYGLLPTQASYDTTHIKGGFESFSVKSRIRKGHTNGSEKGTPQPLTGARVGPGPQAVRK